MVQFKVGDSVVLCASLDDFCGTETNIYMVRDINISLPPCSITTFTPAACLNFSGINISFGWTAQPTDPGLNVCPTMLSGVLGSATTNDQGVASCQYTITQQDLDLYNANSASFDLAACITNSPIDVDNGIREVFRPGDPISIVQNLCLNVSCADKCFGTDMWAMKCDPLTGICVQDIMKVPNTPLCSGSHYIEYDWSFLPIDFLNLVASGIVDISNVLGTDLPMPSNIVYKGATFSSGKFRVYVQYTPITASSPVKLSVAQLANMTPQALTELLQAGTVLDLDFQPTSGLQTMLSLPPMDINIYAATIGFIAIMLVESWLISKSAVLAASPWTWAVALAIAAGGAIVLGYKVNDMIFGTSTSGTLDKSPADKTKDANTTLETELAKCLAAYPCVTAIPPTPPCSVVDTNKYDTCAKAAVLINKINTDAIAGTPSSITQADVQAILDAYSDRQTALTNGLITVQEALAQIAAEIAKAKQEAADKLAAETCGSGQIYDPSVMKCVQTADCWIAGFVPGTCMLTAKTGKTIAIIGGVVIGGVILISLFKK